MVRSLFDSCSINRMRAFDQSKGPLDQSKLKKTKFSAEFSGDCSERLKSFQTL